MKKFALIIAISSLNSLFAMTDNHVIIPSNGPELAINMNKAHRANIQMPSSDNLYRQLESRGLDKFAKHTLIHKQLGNQTKTTQQIIRTVDSALYSYTLQFKNEDQRVLTRKHRKGIVQALLQKNLDAYIILQDCNYL